LEEQVPAESDRTSKALERLLLLSGRFNEMKPPNSQKRSTLSRVLVSVLLVALIRSYGIAAICQDTSDPERIFQEVKTAAQSLAETDSAIIKPPVFRFVEKTKELEYYLGGVKVEALQMQSDDPYLTVFERQLRTEALRKLFKHVIPKELFWQPFLERLDQLVLLTIRDIETTHNQAELQAKLANRSEELDRETQKLNEAIRAFAQDRGYTARRVGRGLASDTFSVSVIKKPADGRVQVLPWVKYVMCSNLKKCGSPWPWRELVSADESMIGEYYYQAEWPGGRRNEGKIDIRNNTTITFSPRN
jgi:hypothetical protein